MMVRWKNAVGFSAVLMLMFEPAGSNSGHSGPSPKTSQYGVVEDVDGHTYRAVRIGTQYWMTANLRTTRYSDGSPIHRSMDAEAWSEGAVGAYCLPESDPRAPEGAYGFLYNFAAVDHRPGLCPGGWHVPTAAEWHALIDHLGGVEIAGGRMKDVSSGLWRTPVAGTSNASGFSALPAGGRGRFGSASDAGYFATWWAATSHDSAFAWHWGLYPDSNAIRFNPGHKSSGFSVRCVRD
jgi:uncharacterized protein (TIGR02145 family)